MIEYTVKVSTTRAQEVFVGKYLELPDAKKVKDDLQQAAFKNDLPIPSVIRLTEVVLKASRWPERVLPLQPPIVVVVKDKNRVIGKIVFQAARSR